MNLDPHLFSASATSRSKRAQLRALDAHALRAPFHDPYDPALDGPTRRVARPKRARARARSLPPRRDPRVASLTALFRSNAPFVAEALVDQYDQVQRLLGPEQVDRLCRAWDAFCEVASDQSPHATRTPFA